MLKRILLVIIIIFLIIVTNSFIRIDSKTINTHIPIYINTYKEKPIGNLYIERIKLNKDIYSINSKENTIEKNIELITYNNNLIVIAAHSGTGKLAYFNDLDKLKINDELLLTINNKRNIYIINNIYEQKKLGYINISKEERDQLVLTTCSPNHQGYQLIVNSIKKESN